MQMYISYKELISKEMNNDNDLNLHSMTKLSGWLCYCDKALLVLMKVLLIENIEIHFF